MLIPWLLMLCAQSTTQAGLLEINALGAKEAPQLVTLYSKRRFDVVAHEKLEKVSEERPFPVFNISGKLETTFDYQNSTDSWTISGQEIHGTGFLTRNFFTHANVKLKRTNGAYAYEWDRALISAKANNWIFSIGQMYAPVGFSKTFSTRKSCLNTYTKHHDFFVKASYLTKPSNQTTSVAANSRKIAVDHRITRKGQHGKHVLGVSYFRQKGQRDKQAIHPYWFLLYKKVQFVTELMYNLEQAAHGYRLELDYFSNIKTVPVIAGIRFEQDRCHASKIRQQVSLSLNTILYPFTLQTLEIYKGRGSRIGAAFKLGFYV